jgi:hypothetical protein
VDFTIYAIGVDQPWVVFMARYLVPSRRILNLDIVSQIVLTYQKEEFHIILMFGDKDIIE